MSTTLCPTCLSMNRKLFTLNIEKYQGLFGFETMIDSLKAVCWECMSMFRKVTKFKLQVLKAQMYLKSSCIKDPKTASLSHLTFSSFNYNDICCDHLEYLSDGTQKQSILIKNNLAQSINLENDFNTYNDISVRNNFILLNLLKDNTTVASIETQGEVTIKNENNSENIISNIPIEEICIDTALKAVKREKIAHIITEMNEEEMLEKRETDRQADRYKNKVKYRCEMCICGFFHKELYEKHMRNRHSEKAGSHKCTICETRFTRTNYFKEHIESHYRKYKCRMCGYIGYKLSEMVAHDAKEHDVRRFICKVCHEEFPSPSSFRFHRETKHEAPVKCESCGKMFRTKNSLRVHTQQMHSYKPKSPCTVCGARVRYMRSHMLKHEAAPEAAYCTECDQRFASIVSYKSHLKYSARHRADTVLKHACKLCDARFVNSTALKKHCIARHSTERPFKCDRCGKGFEAQYKLKLHILHAHEGVEKPKDKICHICGRGFNTKSMLSNHIRVHTGEKPFRCDICGAAFSQKSSLTTHTRGVHLKIKPRPGRGHSAS